MKSSAAFWIICMAAAYLVSVSASCTRSVSCPCSSSNTTHKLCVDDSTMAGDPCGRWSQCQTCRDYQNHCETCPPDRTGPNCTEVVERIVSRRKRQFEIPENPFTQIGSCRRLESPDLGSISCYQSGNYRVCTGRCLPGYRFDDDSGEEEITLECRRGTWVPYRSFPPCRARGYCNLERVGSGRYNCTIGMDGSRCDIQCNGGYQGRYHCYPGRGWTPSLPYCMRPKDPDDGRAPCRCSSGRICDSEGDCVCPRGRTGPYCEQSERDRTVCPDPGIPYGTDRFNGDGTPASYPRDFEEGETVVYSCSTRGSALQGTSLITCFSSGEWSAPTPRCVRPQNPTTTVCPDPGMVANGNRVNTDGSSSGFTQTYAPGQSVVFSCRQGYALSGPSLLTCLRTGQWSSRRPRCQRTRNFGGTSSTTVSPLDEDRVSCAHPGVVSNGRIESHPLLDARRRGQRLPYGTELTYSCDFGYEMYGSEIIFCQPNGEWSALPPVCVKETITERPPEDDNTLCEYPGVDVNGKIVDNTDLPIDPRRRGQKFPFGTKLTYSCNEEYDMEGSDIIFCLPNGEWSAPAPSCNLMKRSLDPDRKSGSCENPGPISNGRLVVTLGERHPGDKEDDFEYPVGTRLQYSCEYGYALTGNSSLVCESNGFWNNDIPICVEGTAL